MFGCVRPHATATATATAAVVVLAIVVVVVVVSAVSHSRMHVIQHGNHGVPLMRQG